MNPDPNWLYSAIAQSSAAIVAIIGGFIMSTLLLLSSNREGLLSVSATRRKELEALKIQRAELLGRRNRRIVELRIRDSLEKLITVDGLPTAVAAQELLKVPTTQAEDFDIEWKLFSEIIKTEKNFLEKQLKNHPPKGGEYSFWTWAESNDINTDEHDYRIASELFRVLTDRPKPESRVTSSLFSSLAFSTPSISAIALETPEMRQAQREREQERKRELDGFLADAEIIKRQITLAEANLSVHEERFLSFRYPKNVVSALVILGIFAVSGIILPFLMMPQRSDDYLEWHKWVTIGGFAFGLLLFFGYVVWFLRTLRANGETTQEKLKA